MLPPINPTPTIVKVLIVIKKGKWFGFDFRSGDNI
jgi:hypothetical protein